MADLEAWAARADEFAQGGIALQRMKLCFANQLEVSLDLRGLGLMEAPPHFPETVETIDLRGNRFREFSTPVPNGLNLLQLDQDVIVKIKEALPEGLTVTTCDAHPAMPGPHATSRNAVSPAALPDKGAIPKSIPTAPGLVMDARFGEFGYTRENPPSRTSYQFRLTAGAAGRAQYAEPVPVDMEDIGYAAHIAYAGGRREPIVPGAVPNIMHSAETPHGVGYTAPWLPNIGGKIVRLPQSGGVVDYVMFMLSGRNRKTGISLRNIYCQPFSAYQQPDGRIVGMVYCGSEMTAYRFDVDTKNIPLPEQNKVTLTPATMDEIAFMSGYRALVRFELHTPSPVLCASRRLKDETPEVKAQFEAAFECACAMLDRAISAGRKFPVMVERTLAKLLGRQEGDPRLLPMLEKISSGWTRMRNAMPYLKSQSPHAVGIFNSESLEGMEDLKGISIRDSLRMPLGLERLRYPVLGFSRPLLINASAPPSMKAANLLHECAHMFLGARDRMNPQNPIDIYSGESRNHRTVFLSSLEKSAALEGSQPENHAATFEVFTEMCSYLTDPKTEKLIRKYLESPDCHQYRRDMAGLIDKRAPAEKPSAAIKRPAPPSPRITSVRLRQ